MAEPDGSASAGKIPGLTASTAPECSSRIEYRRIPPVAAALPEPDGSGGGSLPPTSALDSSLAGVFDGRRFWQGHIGSGTCPSPPRIIT